MSCDISYSDGGKARDAISEKAEMSGPLTSKERGIDNPGLDDGGITDAGRAVIAPDSLPQPEENRVLNLNDRAIVDEAFLRGASVVDVMTILLARAQPKADIGVPTFISVPGIVTEATSNDARGGIRIDESGQPVFAVPVRPSTVVVSQYSRGLVAGSTMDAMRRLGGAQDFAQKIEAAVMARCVAYVTLANNEFNTLAQFVRSSFRPVPTGPYADPYSTAEEKYRAMRGAYYRAGWTHIKLDVLDKIVPTKFLGMPVIGGTHIELQSLLARIETTLQRTKPDLARQKGGGGFSLGGFNPRFQAGSDQLSNHAYGLAIDIDGDWNPHLREPKVRQAFQHATGEDVGLPFYDVFTEDALHKAFERIERMSRKLQAWLKEWMPKLEKLESERSKMKNDPKKKEELAKIDKKLGSDPDLVALKTLINVYTVPTVQSWKAYGIQTISQDVVDLFKTLGVQNRARWGGEYRETKDIMHLELLRLASSDSPERSNRPRRRPPVKGLQDLYRPDARPVPVNGPK